MGTSLGEQTLIRTDRGVDTPWAGGADDTVLSHKSEALWVLGVVVAFLLFNVIPGSGVFFFL